MSRGGVAGLSLTGVLASGDRVVRRLAATLQSDDPSGVRAELDTLMTPSRLRSLSDTEEEQLRLLDAVAADGEPDREGPARRGAASEASWRWREGPPEVRHEIDLRGRRAAEAWAQLDLLIDRAIPAGLDEILVVHGIGTGKLRQFLLERLAADPRVARAEEAPAERGGAGATIVLLADD